jgi:hypothetical protein
MSTRVDPLVPRALPPSSPFAGIANNEGCMTSMLKAEGIETNLIGYSAQVTNTTWFMHIRDFALDSFFLDEYIVMQDDEICLLTSIVSDMICILLFWIIKGNS